MFTAAAVGYDGDLQIVCAAHDRLRVVRAEEALVETLPHAGYENLRNLIVYREVDDGSTSVPAEVCRVFHWKVWTYTPDSETSVFCIAILA